MKFQLHQNYPNPFNSETEISFSLETDEDVRLIICDLLGKMIAVIADERINSGSHKVSWNGQDYLGKSVPSGVYVYSLQSGQSVQSRKLLLIR